MKKPCCPGCANEAQRGELLDGRAVHAHDAELRARHELRRPLDAEPAHNPNVVLVVAPIHEIRPGCGDDDSVQKRAEELIKAVPAWAQGQSTAQSPVFVADLWRMAENWYDALKGIPRRD